jgi:CheB methylesterase
MMPRKAAGRSKSEVSRAAERAKNSGRQAKAKSIAPKTATPLRKRSALKDGAELDHAFPVSGDRRVGRLPGSVQGILSRADGWHRNGVRPHSAPGFELSQHAGENLSKATRVPVDYVEERVNVKPNRVRDASRHVHGDYWGCLHAYTAEPGTKSAFSGQFLLAFAAEERKSSAIGVILSDIGIDGTLGLEDINAEGDFKYLPQVFACYGSMFIPQARATIRIEQASTFKNALAAQRCCMHSSDGAGASDFRDFSGLSPAKENRTGSRWTLLIHSETALAVPEPKQPGRRAPHIRFDRRESFAANICLWPLCPLFVDSDQVRRLTIVGRI